MLLTRLPNQTAHTLTQPKIIRDGKIDSVRRGPNAGWIVNDDITSRDTRSAIAHEECCGKDNR